MHNRLTDLEADIVEGPAGVGQHRHLAPTVRPQRYLHPTLISSFSVLILETP